MTATQTEVQNTAGLFLHRPSHANAVSEDVKEVERNGRTYLVFPLVAMREMVMSYPDNDPPTEEYLPKERIQESAELWSGMPLSYIHPENERRTAADPVAYTSFNIGEVHSPEIVGENDDKLRLMGWVDVEKALSIGELAEDVVNQLRAGDELSVSAGYVTLDDQFSGGSFNGTEYDVEQGVVIPDHVAVFPSDEFRARCSPEDGCAAPRVNAIMSEVEEGSLVTWSRGEDASDYGRAVDTIPAGETYSGVVDDQSPVDGPAALIELYEQTDGEWKGTGQMVAQPLDALRVVESFPDVTENALTDQPEADRDTDAMTNDTNGQDIDPDVLSLDEHIAPALSPRLNADTNDVQSFLSTLAGDGDDRESVARVVANAYDGLSEAEVHTVLDRAEAGDITVNATMLGKLVGAMSGKGQATVDPASLQHNAECSCGKHNAEGETSPEDEAGGTETPERPESPSSPDSPGSSTDTEPSDSEEQSSTESSDGTDEPGTDDGVGSDSADTESDTEDSEPDTESGTESTDTTENDNMPDVLSIEQMAAKSAFGLSELQEDWDDDMLMALEQTILENNPQLREESGGEETMNEDTENTEDETENSDAMGSDNKENTTDDSEYVTKDDFNELKSMVEDAVNSKNNAEREQKARTVANAIDGMTEEAALALEDDQLDTLVEKHGGQVTANYGAVAGPVNRNAQGSKTDEDVDEYPAGGRDAWKARNGGD